jgi:hypothetical protein
MLVQFGWSFSIAMFGAGLELKLLAELTNGALPNRSSANVVCPLALPVLGGLFDLFC